MKNSRIQTLLGVVISVVGLDQAAHAQFTTLEAWGNASGTSPEPSFSQTAGTIAITAGGEDFYGNSDKGAFLWNDTGSMTTTGDFTASARHVGTTNPAPEWGRDGIMVRATQSAGTLSANDAYWMATRKSNGQLVINRRSAVGAATYRATDIGNAAVNFDSDENDQALATGDVRSNPIFLSAGRSGNRLYSGFAMDLGGGVAGRWVEKWSTDVEAVVSELQGGKEVVVGLAHQSHPQTIQPDENDINTATFDNWSYAGSFNGERFGLPAGAANWLIDGTVHGDPATGQVLGSAYVSENGVATGEPVKWTLTVYPRSSFTPKYGTSGARKDTRRNFEAMDPNSPLLVSKDNFRQGGPGSAPGLTADIYLNPGPAAEERAKGANAGSLAGNLALMTAPGITKTSVVIPQVFWNNNAYPQNDEGENIFAKAFNDTLFTAQEDNYGVEMKGQIFIPAAADRNQPDLPGKFILFKDGTDDFTYLEIDGKPLLNDNDWTGVTSASPENGGGHITVFDVSDPKYDDGEWVSFRMIMWEGGGGDNTALYWSVTDGKDGAEPLFDQESVPGTFGNLVPKTGVANSRKDTTLMQPDDLVPASDFRHPTEGGGTAPGLKADIYPVGHPGNIDAINNLVQGEPASSVILPNIFWYNTASRTNYPSNGQGGDVFGDAGATPEADTNAGYSNYGVNMTGEIFIPGKAQRTALPVAGGDNLILFKDGVDDFTYLEIDGQILISDNDWTGITSTDNGGGQVSLMDVSDPKFDNGAWVSFRMTTWEGGGGDTGALYWSARDTNATFGVSAVPGTTAPAFQATGTAQIGSDTESGRFGTVTLPAGEWLTVLDIANTGTSMQRLSTVTVTGTPVEADIEVTSLTFNPATTVLNLSFTSEAGSQYALEYTIGFQAAGDPPSAAKWNVVPSHATIAGAAGTTAIAPLTVSTLVAPGGLLPDAGKAFFRIRKL